MKPGSSEFATSIPAGRREGFSSNLGVIAATLGSAVGLGNIWKFPYLTGAMGGAAFILVYLVCTVLVGLPVMIAEIALGRNARSNPVRTLRRLSAKGQPWSLLGLTGVTTATFIMAFYSEVAGWVFAYVFNSGSGRIFSYSASRPAEAANAFSSLISSPFQALFWQWVVLISVSLIIISGVSKGIEKTTKFLMPVLFFFLLILGVKGLFLPGAAEGLRFLFKPDFTRINGTVILTAMGLAFFKLSVGMGTMITYGSYFKDEQNIPSTAMKVMLSDLFVSMLAGIAIFPAVFSYGFKPEAGASLLFVTLPAVFAGMPFGRLFAVLFFALAGIASLGAMLSMLEVPVRFLSETFKLGRKSATIVSSAFIAFFGCFAALSESSLKNFKIFGMTSFNFYDCLTSNLLMPIGGILTAVFVGWFFSPEKFRNELTNHGGLGNQRLAGFIFMALKYITPLLICIILLHGLGVF